MIRIAVNLLSETWKTTEKWSDIVKVFKESVQSIRKEKCSGRNP
jgi:hypothetical protein